MKQIEVYAIWEDRGWLVISDRQIFCAYLGEWSAAQLRSPTEHAYLRMCDPTGTEVEAVRLSDEINVDLAPDGAVDGIELLNANAQLRATDGGRLVVIDEVAGRRIEIPLPNVA